MGFGTVVGWPSANLLILQSKETPLPTGPLTIDEISWVGSLMCIGGLLGNSVFGWLSNLYGRKIPLLIAAIPHFVIITIIKKVIELYL